MSQASYLVLEKIGGYHLKLRGEIPIKVYTNSDSLDASIEKCRFDYFHSEDYHQSRIKTTF